MSREAHVRFWEGAGLKCSALLDYLRAYENGTQLRRGLTEYFDFYNTRRTHQALDYKTPDDVYYGRTEHSLLA
jgi:transposase InsO family protein